MCRGVVVVFVVIVIVVVVVFVVVVDIVVVFVIVVVVVVVWQAQNKWKKVKFNCFTGKCEFRVQSVFVVGLIHRWGNRLRKNFLKNSFKLNHETKKYAFALKNESHQARMIDSNVCELENTSS